MPLLTTPQLLNFDEHLRIINPEKSLFGEPLAIRLGSGAIIVENIDDLYSGATTRGQDTARVYMPGSIANPRVRGSAEYTISMIVSGEDDVTGFNQQILNPGATRAEQAILNIDELKQLTIRPSSNQPPLLLRWYNRPGVEEEYIEAEVQVGYDMQVRRINQDHYRVVMTFINAKGVWLGPPRFGQLEVTGNAPTTGGLSQVPIPLDGPIGGNTGSSELTVAGNGGTHTRLDFGFPDTLRVEPRPGQPAIRDFFLANNSRVFVETASFPSTFNPDNDIKTGLVAYTSQRWLELSPNTNAIGIRREGSGTCMLTATARGCYV